LSMSFFKHLAQKKRVQSWKTQAKETTGCTVKFSTIFLCLTGLWVLFWKKWLRRKQMSIISVELKKGVVVFSSAVRFSIYGFKKKWLRYS
jgi:hypothetical protein